MFDCDTVVSEFELQSIFHFRSNNDGESIKLPNTCIYRVNITTTVFSYKKGFGMKITHDVWCTIEQIKEKKIFAIRRILIKVLTIGNTAGSCTFLKVINSNGFFKIPEDCQHDLLYSWLRPVLFLYHWVGVLPPHGLSFRLLKHLLDRTKFSVGIIYFTLNFTCFVLLNHQRFNERTLFKTGAVYLICPWNKWVGTPVSLLRSLSDKCFWEWFESHYVHNNRFNRITAILPLGSNHHQITHEGWYTIKQRY